MALYQRSVLSKYLNQQDKEQLHKAYKKYTKYFLSPAIQENIRNTKEEQYQGLFLTELFVKVLGYTLKPNTDFNLVAEYKNQNNARKADGAILKEDNAIGVIELKGTKTKDLESIRRQAFDYKANQKGCVYVITSNFEKLRFYINDATEFEEFNLFELTEERFALLYLCLQKDNILTNVPLQIKEASIIEEDQITKNFYKDYSLFKRELYRDLVKRNGKRLKNVSYAEFTATTNATEEDTAAEYIRLEKNVKLTLFKKSQKLIDRFLFIFFAEDRDLLPANSTIQILNKWKADIDFGDERPLFDLFKQYFRFLDKGRQGTTSRAEIYAYNGGLFKEDTIIDSLEIDNDLLYTYAYKLAKYDFESQVDVNILGHIFENSLNEIESVNAEIQGADFDKQTSKRKKDGVFYTPKYITKYIVENTIGKLCEEQKAALGLKEEEYYKGRKNRQKSTIKNLIAILDEYREWLLQLTICDPACGSGAFLNQALDFLISEHNYIDELKAKILGGAIVFSDIENTVLENNIYGVDLNEESVEIAKLSLWLRTAQPRRKLNDLSSNIKCGNSLIDSKTVAGDKAFHWETEFPHIFEKGGFDVVIGNPPYVNINTLSKDVHQYFKKEYKTIHTGYNDLMYYFMYRGIDMLKKEGVFGVITSNYFIGNEYAKTLREFLSVYVSEILNFGDYLVFEDANVHTAIVFAEKDQKKKSIKYSTLKNTKESLLSIESNRFDKITKDREALNQYWIFASNDKNEIIKKITSKGKLLGEIAEIEKGSTSGKNDVFTVSKEIISKYNLEKEVLRKNVKNGDISKYSIHDRETFLIYTDNDTIIEKYPNILNYFNLHKEVLSNRNEVKKGSYDWWRMERPRRKEVYDANEKIIVPYRATNNRFAYDNERRFNDGGDIRVLLINYEKLQVKYVLGVLNSNLIDWYYGFIGKPKGNAREYFNEPLSKIPIFLANDEIQVSIVQFVDSISGKLEKQQSLSIKFSGYLKLKFSLEKLPKKLQNWYELSFGEFIKELNKAIKETNKVHVIEEKELVEVLTKKDEFEWLELFEEKKKEAQELQTQINATDKQIDTMVYELYGLTEDEIAIVEAS
ncbi:N-6 DNA methylase [Kordia sp. YSTF-M3]|uniref:site-specific DNA-methyltransferase (adenine-specific) n=1 Tax=Kordia aestuariivivens TaxID=2759037 RepID=A0ABR7QBN7_9FLAO|nr:N-6 DNA methylase [Kordia aestuariivivens]MBC8755975.1 N-6 DNA methylase [Kordia aestuariivivens]